VALADALQPPPDRDAERERAADPLQLGAFLPPELLATVSSLADRSRPAHAQSGGHGSAAAARQAQLYRTSFITDEAMADLLATI
jgi:hypothetical protein